MTQVSLHALTKHYPGAPAPAVDGLTLDLAPGSLTAILGPSGCGKTTTMRLIAGLLDPTSGDIRLDGTSVLATPPERRGVVMVFQNHLLFPHMSVAENIGFGLRMQGRPAKETAQRTEEILARVQLTGFARRRPTELSGGQQQRVALARALILRPKVLLLDEPLSNLDASLRAEMRDLVRDLQRETGITTLVVTHDQSEATILADRIALLLDGKLRQVASPAELYARPADTAVARFFGGANFITGQSRSGKFHSALGPLRLPEGAPVGDGILTFRPEEVEVGGAGENSLSAVVFSRAFHGSQSRVTLHAGPVVIEALLPPAAAASLPDAQPFRITLPPAALWVLPPVR
ncbi:ABC transporter ATP-binding protein [Tabrizicola sp. BL-A-41-H6]|uniref:ABC transporter ATP-binding protein n=1 Tax=Tabrizicola sp. BL-A-41-H6 TaxID=3421107 RepID=UPI003D67A5F1